MVDNKEILSEIRLIKKALFENGNMYAPIGDWLPKKAVMRFFDYSDNQMRTLEKESNLLVKTIGRRKFYSTESIIKFLNQK